ncbi:hypothetical protein ACFL2V_21715, partial [Pseudomonadota bacterium]
MPDGEYDPRLLDVPVSDKELSEQLYEYGMEAYDAWKEWREQLGKLYSQQYEKEYKSEATEKKFILTAKELKAMVLPDLTLPYYNPPIAPRNPAGSLDSTDPKVVKNKRFFFDDLVDNRFKIYKAQRAKGNPPKNITSYKLAPPPYREGVPVNEAFKAWVGNDELPPPVENETKPGLIVRRAEVDKDIDERGEELDTANEFIEKISDMLLLQRQQLDAQSVSFATFAGGVAGDGSGLQLTRWLPFVSFDPKIKVKTTEAPQAAPAGDGGDGADSDKSGTTQTESASSAATYTSYYSQPTILSAAYSPKMVAMDTSYTAPQKAYVAADNYGGNSYTADAYLPKNNYVGATYEPEGSYVATKNKVGESGGTTYNANVLPGVSYATNDAYVQMASKYATKSTYEAVSKLSVGIGKLAGIGVASKPVSSGAFKTANNDFGVLKHVVVIDQDLRNSHDAVTDIRKDMDEFIEEIKKFIKNELPKHIRGKVELDKKDLPPRAATLPKLTDIEQAIKDLEAEIDKEIIAKTAIEDDKQNRVNALQYSFLFKVNRFLVREISYTDIIRGYLIRLQKVLQKYIIERKQDIKEKDEEIIEARRDLSQLYAKRIEALEDYTAAQRLVIEHWKAVEDKFNHRNKVLNAMLGLYYVKVRETSTSTKLPEIHTLAYAKVGDLVPGCRRDQEVTLPDELSVFMDAALDIPMCHWTPLTSLIQQLPSKQSLMVLLERRNSRIQSKRTQLSRNTHSRIGG